MLAGLPRSGREGEPLQQQSAAACRAAAQRAVRERAARHALPWPDPWCPTPWPRPRLSFPRAQLQRLVAGAPCGPAAVQLLDELMAVAMERCTEPLLVESAVLDRVLASAKQAGGAGGQPLSLL